MNHLNSLWNLIAAGSLRAGVLIAVVFVLRHLLRGRVPAECFRWLWILVAFRLLVPVPPGSIISVYNILPAVQSEAPKASEARWVVRKESSPAAHGTVAPQTSPTRAIPAGAASAEPAVSLSVLPLIWVGGMIACVLLLARSAWQMRRSILKATSVSDERVLSLAAECARELRLRSPIRLLESSAVVGPAILGLWRPRLILPLGLVERLTNDELRFVLLHECAHLSRRDLAVMWLLTVARAVHWFNPSAWLAVRAARVDTELACDETLLKHAQPDAPVQYGETLLKLTQLINWRRPAIPVVAVSEGKHAMRLRLECIASFTMRSRWRTAAALVIVLAAGLVFAADETTQTPAPEPETKSVAVKAPPDWAKGWSVLWVTLPQENPPKPAEVGFSINGAETKTLKAGEQSESDPWLEKLQSEESRGETQWKVILRKGDERAELFCAMAIVDGGRAEILQVDFEARFLEANDTIIHRLRLQSPKTNVGLSILDDSIHGLETRNLLTAEETTDLVRSLGQGKGIDLISAPRVTTRLGQRAVIEIIREFRYPTEWTPEWDATSKEKFWKPAAFETRNTGVTLEVEPAAAGPRGTVSMRVIPQVVEFLGWRDIETGEGYPVIGKNPSRMTDIMGPARKTKPWKRGARNLPVFSTRKMEATTTLEPGQTYVFTSLPETDDVTPFKSPAKSRRLIALVSAQIVSPGGEPLHKPNTPPRPLSQASIGELLFGAPVEKKKAAAVSPKPVDRENPAGAPRYAKAVAGKPGYVTSPYAPAQGYVDIRGFPPGTEVKCPYTSKVFLVP